MSAVPANSNVINAAPAPSGGGKSQLMLGLGVAALAAVVVTSYMWSAQPDYRVLFSNLNDKDGGAIVSQLSQMNVQYKFSEGGGAIMVPADKVHEARLKLASQGLPRGSSVGFESMDGQKFGVTQFQEHVNYQRALEGELARSIQSLSAVQAARVHLALPKQSVFLREKQKPSASVLVSLHAGRSLDRAQIAGIVHLVSSSVADLSPKQISILDQSGNLLSSSAESSPTGGDAAQLNYVREVEENLSRRIITLLEPLVGRESVRAQVSTDIDFSQIESTAETFTPNQGTDAKVVVRSQTSSEASSAAAGTTGGGIPGALSNTPNGTTGAPNQPAAGGNPARREAVTNYEIDKTIKRVRNQTGTIKRITAAVLINHRKTVDAEGKTTVTPLTEAEMTQIQSLVQEAVGFSKERGDSINVVNAPFSAEVAPTPVETPWWKEPANVSLAKEIGKGLGFVLILLIVVFGVIKPALRAITERRGNAGNGGAVPMIAAGGPSAGALPAPSGEPSELDKVKQIAKNDPAIVANVVRQWVGSNG